jgi:hypothetical protein
VIVGDSWSLLILGSSSHRGMSLSRYPQVCCTLHPTCSRPDRRVSGLASSLLRQIIRKSLRHLMIRMATNRSDAGFDGRQDLAYFLVKSGCKGS